MVSQLFPPVKFIVSGENGTHGLSADGMGSLGAKGHEGTPGKNAGDIALQLYVNNEEELPRVCIASLSEVKYLPLGDPKAKIYIEAKGGKGGTGGDGNDGRTGAHGHKGANATKYSHGEDGGRGGRGGDGGNGALGMPGGDGGHVTVTLHEADTDLLMLLNIPDVSGGKGGQGGSGGDGGEGGAGGEGGSAHHWSTQEMTTQMQAGRAIPVMQTKNHSNPGGRRGSHGLSGHRGKKGSDGKNGKDGTYQIIVESRLNEEHYSRPYDLEILEPQLRGMRSNDTFEPEEDVECILKVQNKGEMSTPANQTVFFSVMEKGWITIDGDSTYEVELGKSLAAGEIYTIAQPLHFRIKEQQDVAMGAPLSAAEKLTFSARMTRVNKVFNNIEKQHWKIPIEYPLIISPIHAPATLSLNEEAPFAFYIENKSDLIVGESAALHRFIQTTFKLDVGPKSEFTENEIIFKDREGNEQPLHEGLVAQIGELHPKERKMISGTISFTSFCLNRSYLTAKFVSSLALSRLHQSNEMKIVQQQPYSLQFADAYTPSVDEQADDLLLVTNSSTTVDEINSWIQLIHSVGIERIAFWNLSKYNGINFEQARRDGGKLIDEFRDKKIIILNNRVNVNGCGSKQAMDFISQMEIFRLARDANIKTYLVGQKGVCLKGCVIPLYRDFAEKAAANVHELLKNIAGNSEKEYHVLRPQKMYFSLKGETHVVSADLIKKANKIYRKLIESFPNERFIIVYDFHPVKVENSHFHYHLGTIEVHRSLRWNEPSIVLLDIEEENRVEQAFDQLHRLHQYNLMKMLSFDEKLALISSVQPNKDESTLLAHAILSDIVEENKACRLSQRPFSKGERKGALPKLQSLCGYVPQPNHELFIAHILIKMKYLTEHLTKFKEKHFNNRRGIITKKSIHLIDSRLKALHQVNSHQLEEIKTILRENYHQAGKKAFQKMLIRPPLNLSRFRMTYDNEDALIYPVMTQQEFLSYQAYEKDICIEESKYRFNSPEERLTAIQEMESTFAC